MGEICFDDTIAAIATPIGEGGISVIRLSGPQAFQIASSVTNAERVDQYDSHSIHLESFRDSSGKKIDQVLLSVFKAPNSYTGEDVVEISGHGGRVVTKRILDRLLQTGARHAHPGEFTKRAFLNGKMDLTQAEAVLDLIQAKSQKSAETALYQLDGSLSRRLGKLRDDFMKIYAHMEAAIDFPDDQLEVYEDVRMKEGLNSLESNLADLVRSFQRGNLIREGISVAIIGKPNVGKSSLFNALLERDRALVSEHPGTTRDHLEEAIEIGGMYIRLVDTAGLATEMKNPLEQMGMDRARRALKQAQLILYVVDGSVPLEDQDRAVWTELDLGKPAIVIVNKKDLPQKLDRKSLNALVNSESIVELSTVTRGGLDQLEEKIADTVTEKQLDVSGEQITRLRHKNALERALDGIKRTQESWLEKKSMEFVTADLKVSLDAIKELVGEVYSEDLLDVIFSEFCIGK